MAFFFVELFTDKIFLSVIISVIIASSFKILTNWIMTDTLDFRVFYKTGGMPSSHAATVVSLATSIYLKEGVTALFVSTLIFGLVIMSDAMGIRQSAGKQAQVLNEIMEDIRLKKFKVNRLYEILGHTPRQVLAGSLLGIIVAHAIHFI